MPYHECLQENGGQRGYKGHDLDLPQYIQSVLYSLHSQASDLRVLVVRGHGLENTHRDFTVRQHRVLQDVEIDRDGINWLPENGIPNVLFHLATGIAEMGVNKQLVHVA